eukprot:4038236-Prymnesium_polylepis.1
MVVVVRWCGGGGMVWWWWVRRGVCEVSAKHAPLVRHCDCHAAQLLEHLARRLGSATRGLVMLDLRSPDG